MDTEVLFIGFLMTKEKMEKICEQDKSLLHFAANKFQWNIVNGLISNGVHEIQSISCTFLSCYPKYPQIFIKKDLIMHNNINILYFPLINLRILKSLSISIMTFFYSLIWLMKNKKRKKIIITYAMTAPFMLANWFVKMITKCPNIIVVLDFPEHMNLSEIKPSLFVSIFQKINIYLAWKMIRSYNAYILLTQHMVSKLNIADKPYVIIEGFADGQSPIKEKIFKKKNGKRIVMYAGTLNRRYGIGNLIESFAYIKNDCYELWLCGSGDYDSDINAIAEKDKRIKHYGVLNNERVVELEGCADILINPRPTNEEYTKFSFPSKNLEYMSTGVPLLTTKLPGMPAEYDDYVFFIEDESPAGIADAILKVGRLSDDELFNFGQKAQSFIYGHKNYHMQGAKILELMSRVL